MAFHQELLTSLVPRLLSNWMILLRSRHVRKRETGSRFPIADHQDAVLGYTQIPHDFKQFSVENNRLSHASFSSMSIDSTRLVTTPIACTSMICLVQKQ